MEDTTSEATSSYLSSQMAYPPWSFQQHTNGVVVHSQSNQHQLFQGEPLEASDQPRASGHRAKLNAAQKKEHKRQSDAKYRSNQKKKLNELSAENKRLEEENRRLSTENGRLQEENGRLIVKNTQLEEYVRGQQSRGEHPAENTQRHESYISQSICQVDHQNIYAQDHRGVDSSNEAVDYMFDSLEMNDGLGMNDLQSLLLPENERNQNGGGAAIHDSAPEQSECSLSGMSHADMAMTEFLMKLDEEVKSNADVSDFTGLEGERTTVGRYSFPSSLIPTVGRINDACGDVSATSLINPRVVGEIYVLFCATIKEMEDLQLEQVTRETMFKWRDTIKDALRVNFNVRFAMEHLKKIACAYFGRLGCLLIQTLDARISQLEAEVNDCKAKRADIYEGSKSCISAAREFNGVPVSTGIFPRFSCNSFIH